MSDNKEVFPLHAPVKNEEARKRLGIKAGFFWITAKKISVAISRCIAAMDDMGYDEDDFKKPVRVNLPVVNDLPPEGVFDTEFCNRYERGGEDGITMTLIPGAVPADSFHEKNDEIQDNTSDVDGTDTETGDVMEENAGAVDDNAADNSSAPELTVVATLPFRHRILAQCIGNGEYLYHVDAGQKKEIVALEMDTDDAYVQNLLLAAENVEAFKKAIEHDIHKAVNAVKKVFPVDGKTPELAILIQFLKTWFETDYVDRGLLVKEWAKGNRVSCINRTPSGANAGGGILTDRGEGFVHDKASLARDVAMGVLARSMDLDIYNLHQAHAKRVDEIVADNKPPFDVFCKAFLNMPGGMDYSRSIVVASVKEAQIGIEAIPARVTEYLNRVLTETDHASPDPVIVDIACGRTSQPMPMTGSANDDEEKPQPTSVLADEPATPETVEQDTTEHHQDTQPLENEPPVSQTEASYQKIRAELHEARKNIPPKNPVDVGKQLAAARGEYVEGISDPNDPKWVKGIQTRDSVYQNQPEAQQEPEKVCDVCGQSGGGNCPDCGAVMGDATYQETFSEPETDHSEPTTDQNESEITRAGSQPELTLVLQELNKTLQQLSHFMQQTQEKQLQAEKARKKVKVALKDLAEKIYSEVTDGEKYHGK
ncbi:hypothetical protein E1890_16970 [Salmonella enterica subsp. enterica serovar Mountpleasant]|nr:hypothetical protein [Salmonella enterica subsp. enterica serovar Mountpleasant]